MGASLEPDPEQIAKDVAAAAGAPAMRVVLAPQDRTPPSVNRDTAGALPRPSPSRADMLFWLLAAAVVAGALMLFAGVFS